MASPSGAGEVAGGVAVGVGGGEGCEFLSISTPMTTERKKGRNPRKRNVNTAPVVIHGQEDEVGRRQLQRARDGRRASVGAEEGGGGADEDRRGLRVFFFFFFFFVIFCFFSFFFCCSRRRGREALREVLKVEVDDLFFLFRSLFCLFEEVELCVFREGLVERSMKRKKETANVVISRPLSVDLHPLMHSPGR